MTAEPTLSNALGRLSVWKDELGVIRYTDQVRILASCGEIRAPIVTFYPKLDVDFAARLRSRTSTRERLEPDATAAPARVCRRAIEHGRPARGLVQAD